MIRFRSSRFIVALFTAAILPGCMHWVPEPEVSPAALARANAGPLRVARTGGNYLVFARGFRVERDTLFGRAFWSSPAYRSDFAIPLTEIQEFQIRRVDEAATTLVVLGGIGLGIGVVALLTAPPSSFWGPP